MEPPDFSTDLQKKLEAAGEAGLTKSKLLTGKKHKEPRDEALQKLVAGRLVANLGTEKTPRYVLAKYFRPLEAAYAAAEGKKTPGKATTFLAKDLGRGTKGAVTAKIDEAIDLLVKEKKLIRLQRGKSVFYLHVASILPLISLPSLEQETVSATEELDVESVTAAYHDLVQETGYAEVRISDLHRRSGVSLEALKRWLLARYDAGTLVPTHGDWSLADAEQRAASIDLHGEKHLRVKLLQ